MIIFQINTFIEFPTDNLDTFANIPPSNKGTLAPLLSLKSNHTLSLPNNVKNRK